MKNLLWGMLLFLLLPQISWAISEDHCRQQETRSLRSLCFLEYHEKKKEEKARQKKLRSERNIPQEEMRCFQKRDPVDQKNCFRKWKKESKENRRRKN